MLAMESGTSAEYPFLQVTMQSMVYTILDIHNEKSMTAVVADG